jgi:aldehyde dehydrogenase (NAD+)
MLPDYTRLLARNCPLIGERWIADASGGEKPHVDPNSGQVVATTRLAGAREVDAAVDAARKAQKAWIALRPDQRRAALERWSALIKAADADLSLMAAAESGIPLSTPAAPLAHAWLDYYAGWADRIEGSSSDAFPTPGLNYTRKEPYGVVGVIIPWNGPLVAISMTCAPALAAGNAVVLKPPSNTPFVALKLGELALQAGLPPGLFCVLPGDAEAGQALASHPGVGKVCFTGGGEIARHVLTAAAQTLKPVFLELGGKSPNLLFDDADLDTALPNSLYACMMTSGQGCVLPTRLLVQDGIYDAVLERLAAATPQLKVGPAYDPASVLGPVISDAACRRILGTIEGARAEHQGRLLCGGARLGGALAGGWFIEPTVFVDVKPDAPLAREEIFGPVLTVIRFGSEDEALAIANDSFYGLGAYVHTRQLDRALRLADRLEAGYVTVNSYPAMNPNAPFGGYKRSGYGRVGGREGLEEYLQTKNVHIALPAART